MAGAEAEKELLDLTVTGDGNDRDQIALMAEERPGGADWDKLEPGSMCASIIFPFKSRM